MIIATGGMDGEDGPMNEYDFDNPPREEKPVYGDARDDMPETAPFRIGNGEATHYLKLTDKTFEESKGHASKTHAVRLKAIERVADILEKRIDGWTIRQIAYEYEVSQGFIHKLLNKEFDKIERRAKESSETLRNLHNERLEAMYRAILPTMKKGNARAIDMGIKIMERQAKLHGLDAPEKKQIDVTVEWTDGELIRKAEQLGFQIPDALRDNLDQDIIDAEFILQRAINDKKTEAKDTETKEGPSIPKE